jgi:thioesterase domain-containing protein
LSPPAEGSGALTPEQRELYELLLKKKDIDPSRGSIPRRTDPAAPAPLSYAQHRLWFFNRLAPDSPAYHIPYVFRLRGPLDRAALEKSLNEIVRRHEILRVTCRREGSRPVQTAAPALAVPLEVVDLRSRPDPERATEVRRIVAEATRRPFDLSRGPMLRTGLIRTADDEHVLIFVTHHFVSDGWSMRIWMQELRTLYAGFHSGTAVRLPDLPVQYPDYACWQRGAARAAAMKQELAFWKERLIRAPKEMPLPADHPARPKAVSPGAKLNIAFSSELSDRLQELSRQEGVTLFILLLAGLQAVLHRLCDIEDVLVGTPVSTRTRVELETLIGNFANYLLLTTNLSGDPTFRDLISRARTVAAEAFAHQEAPLEMLAEALQATGQSHLIPSLQVLFVLREGVLEEVLEFPEIDIERIDVDLGAARVDLYLDLAVGRHGIRGTMTYSLDRFEPATVERIVDRLRLLLARASEDPDRRISELLADADLIRGAGAPVAPAAGADLPEFRNPKDSLELQLRGIWERVLDRAPIGSDDDFFDVGGTSVLAMSVYAEIQQTLGVTLSEDAIIQAPTVGKLGRMIRDGGWTSPWTHLVPLQPAGDKPGLFLIHGLEGSVLPYALLARYLGGGRPVYALQATHIREDDGFEDLARKYLTEIRAAQPAGPYHLGGYCTGGIVAHELAHQLRAAGQAVGAIVQMDPLFFADGTRWVLLYLRNVVRWRRFLKRLHESAVGRALKRIGLYRRPPWEIRFRDGTWVLADPDADTARRIEAHVHMRRKYDLRPWEGRVHVFLSGAMITRKHSPVPMWKELALGGLEVAEVPGRHTSMLAEPHVGVLAEKMRRALAEMD